MILTLKKDISKEQYNKIIEKIEQLGFKPHVSHGQEKTVVGVIGENAILTREIFEAMEGVDFITPITKPYKLVSREWKKESTIIKIDDVEIGGKKIVLMAGPCAVENKKMIFTIARAVKNAGASVLRGGAFKPRTSPYSFQGLGEKGLKFLAEVREKIGIKIITEVMSIQQIPLVSKYADIVQIGARNVQNFDLLKELGKIKKPVLLKRGMATTIKEYLMSAEYVVSHGNSEVILCERGIRTFNDETRFTLDLSAVPLLKTLTHLPVIVDPSHGTGVRSLVIPMSKAAIACGADGLLIEVHPNPENALSDGFQSLFIEDFVRLTQELKPLVKAVGRDL